MEDLLTKSGRKRCVKMAVPNLSVLPQVYSGRDTKKGAARRFILYPRMWTRRKKGWGKTLAKRCSEENDSRQCESFFMDRSRCRKLPLRLTEKPISMDSFKNVEFLEHGQSKKVWNPCNKTLVQGSESFRMDKVATVDER